MKKLNSLTAILASAAMIFAGLSTVSCSDGGDSSAPSVVGYQIKTQATKKVFKQGEEFSFDGLEVQEYLSNKKAGQIVEDAVAVISDFIDEDGKIDLSSSDNTYETVYAVIKLNDEVLKDSKGKNDLKYEVTLTKVPTSVVVTYPTDFITEYFAGEQIDLSDVTVTAYFGEDDETGTDVTELATVSGNNTTENGSIVWTYADISSDGQAFTVTPYDGGLVTSANVEGTNTTDDGYTGSLYRGWTFTTAAEYNSAASQWATKTTISTDLDLEANKYYKVTFVLGSSIAGQSTAINVKTGDDAVYSNTFTTGATENLLTLYVSTGDTAAEDIHIDIGHGWTGPDNTFTIKNLKIVEEDISKTTSITIFADKEEITQDGTVTLITKSDMGYTVPVEYTIVSETASSDSEIEDGVLTFGSFDEGETTSVITVKSEFGEFEDTIDITVNFASNYDESDYTFGEVIESEEGWTYNTQKTAGVYTTKGLKVKFSEDGKALIFNHNHGIEGWDNNYDTQVVIGACPGTEGLSAGDVYTVSFNAFFAEAANEITDPENYKGNAYTTVKMFSKDVTAAPNQYKDNASEAVLGFMLGYLGNTNTLTIYDIEVTKKSSYTPTDIEVIPAASEKIELAKDATKQFTAVDSEYKAARSVTWSVNPATAGTISETGLFTAGSVDTDTEVTIIASYAEGVTATSKVTVKSASYVVPYAATLYNKTDNGAWFRGTLTWTSDDYALTTSSKITNAVFSSGEKVSTVTIEAVNGKTATIFYSAGGAAFRGKTDATLSFRVEAAAKTADVVITYTDADVKKPGGSTTTVSEVKVTDVKEITLSKSKVSFDEVSETDTVTETVTVTAVGLALGTVTAVSDDEDVATVSVSGGTVTITPVADGDAVITVSMEGVESKEIKVHVGAVANLVSSVTTSLYTDAAGGNDSNVTISDNVVTVDKLAATGWGHPWSSQLFLKLDGSSENIIENGKSYTLTLKLNTTITLGAGNVIKLGKGNEAGKEGDPIGASEKQYEIKAGDNEVTIDFTANATLSSIYVCFSLGECGASTVTISDIFLSSN